MALTWLRAAAVAALATQTVAQQCYYPNGNEAPGTEKPCSSKEGSACCPDTWECLDNGLCYNPGPKIYGRYSCTDKDWNSPNCPSNLCTYNMVVGGAEAVQQCAAHNNDWCCDANRVDIHCCESFPTARPFFQLQDGRAYATIGRNQASNPPVLATITGLAESSGGGSSPSRTSAPSSGGTPASASPSASGAPVSVEPSTSISRSISSGSNGLVTVERTIITTPSANAAAGGGGGDASSGGSSNNIGLIVGCAVGIPLALALLAIIIWLLRKRRNQKKNVYKDSPEMHGDGLDSPGFAGGAAAKLGKDTYRHSRPGTSEIDGAPVGPVRPISNLPGRAELDSGTGFQPGHGPAFGPDTVGIGGGNGDGQSTWGSAPPGYSPGMNQTGFSQHPTAMELADTSVMPVINEKEAPHQQQYQAYRPPQPAAELPTIKTPPEDVEKQLQK